MSSISELNKKLLFAIFSTCLVGAFHHGYHMTAFNIPHSTLKEWIIKAYGNKTESNPYCWPTTSAMFPLGAFFGSLFTNLKFGPKKVLFYVSLLTLAGQSLMNMSKEVDSVIMLNFGRFIVGVSTGVCSSEAPFYLWDIVPEGSQRIVVVFYQVFITLSMDFSQVVGMILTRYTWIMGVTVATVPLALGILFLIFCRESPKHTLIHKQNDSRTISQLIWFRNSLNVSDAFEQIKQEHNAIKLSPEVTLKNIWGKKLLLCFVGTTSEQLCGISILIYYSSEILHDVGMKNDEPYYTTIGMGLCMFLGTVIALVTIGTLKPKTLLLISLALMFLTTIFLTIILLAVRIEGEKWMFLTCLGSVLSYGFAYGLGIAPIRWLLVLENFTFVSRSVAAALVLPVNFFISTMVVYMFLLININLRYYIFMGSIFFDLVFFVYIYFYMPSNGAKEAS